MEENLIEEAGVAEKPFTQVGNPSQVFANANLAIEGAASRGCDPEHFALDVLHNHGLVKFTMGWKAKTDTTKWKIAVSNDIAQWTRGGVYSSAHWSFAFQLAGVDYYVGLRKA